MADEAIENKVVVLTASGYWSTSKLAKHFGYSVATMRNMQDRLRERIRERQEQDARNVVLTHVRLGDMLELSCNAIESIVGNPTHKEYGTTARWIIERMAPTPTEQRQAGDVGQALEGFAKLATELVQSRQLTATVRLGPNGHDPHVTDQPEDAPFEPPPQLPEPDGSNAPDAG